MCNCTDTGFNGTECQFNIDDCAILDPCKNNASCTDLIKVRVSYGLAMWSENFKYAYPTQTRQSTNQTYWIRNLRTYFVF